MWNSGVRASFRMWNSGVRASFRVAGDHDGAAHGRCRGDGKGCDRAGARDYAAFLGFFFLEPS